MINAYAAEHTEIHTADATADAARVRNAGAVFVGPWAPVSLGDYCAGSNHVLPTGGCACHSSGLSVRSFPRRCTSSSTPATPWPRWPATSSPWPTRRTCPATGRRSTCASTP